MQLFGKFSIFKQSTLPNNKYCDYQVFLIIICFYLEFFPLISLGKSSRDVEVNVMDCDIVVNEFELQPRYYVHFRTNTCRKDINSFILLAMG